MSYEMNALTTMAGAGRLVKLANEIHTFLPEDASTEQRELIDHIRAQINRQAIDERDAAIALMSEVTP